jgi:hypothetical protein
MKGRLIYNKFSYESFKYVGGTLTPQRGSDMNKKFWILGVVMMAILGFNLVGCGDGAGGGVINNENRKVIYEQFRGTWKAHGTVAGESANRFWIILTETEIKVYKVSAGNEDPTLDSSNQIANYTGYCDNNPYFPERVSLVIVNAPATNPMSGEFEYTIYQGDSYLVLSFYSLTSRNTSGYGDYSKI